MRSLRSRLLEATATIVLIGSGASLAGVVFAAWRIGQGWASPSTWAATPEPLRGAAAPAFLLETLAGDTVSAPIRGGRTLLIAYSTTCKFCAASVPNWRRVVQAICKDSQVILISAERLELQQRFWLKKRNLNPGTCSSHPPIIGRILATSEVTRSYGLRRTPTHFIIDENGVVQQTWIGSLRGEAGLDSILAALAGQEDLN
jgi:peroxiredoxin